jgi:ribonuclease HI
MKKNESSPILFFDGASAGNPGVAGAGGVIIDSDGQNILDYSWGLGNTTNNKAESLAVYMGLQIARSRNLHELIVLGDSELIIKELLGIKQIHKSSSQWSPFSDKNPEISIQQDPILSYSSLPKSGSRPTRKINKKHGTKPTLHQPN